LVCGWTRLQILVSAVKALQQSGPSGVYAAVEKPLQIWQTAALLEIFNSIVGIVRSPVMATLPQIGSRIYLTWGILFSFPQVRSPSPHFLLGCATNFYSGHLSNQWSSSAFISLFVLGKKMMDPTWLP
jgi:hypothetical protein